MDLAAQYCPTRKSLEKQNWALVSRLASLTGELLKLTGADHQEFMTVKSRCVEIRAEILQVQDQLQYHRCAHGC